VSVKPKDQDTPEAVATALATAVDGKDPESVTFSLTGASVTVSASAKETVFNRQDFMAFVRQAQSLVSSL
jgi:phage tail sheath gpL-like